jgi:F0F1-type ATP synthase assembly protein I
MSAESTGTKICPHCHEQIDDKTLVCPHCGKSANERQTPSNAFSILENNLEKRIQTKKPSESQKEEDSKPPDNKNSGGSGLGCFLTASFVSLAIAGISYFLCMATYNEENPWGIMPFIFALVISVPIAVISGIIGIIMKITAKKR